MGTPKSKETAPLMIAYGRAVYVAQLLESGLQLLLLIAAHERSTVRPTKPANLDDPKTLGALFKRVLELEYVTDAEKDIIWKAVRVRNILVHSYWDERHTLATLTAAGRKWLIDDLVRCWEQCRRAEQIVSAMINSYLKMHRTSIDELSMPLFEQWQNDEQPPDHVLH